jgi:hypothetical protein
MVDEFHVSTLLTRYQSDLGTYDLNLGLRGFPMTSKALEGVSGEKLLPVISQTQHIKDTMVLVAWFHKNPGVSTPVTRAKLPGLLWLPPVAIKCGPKIVSLL